MIFPRTPPFKPPGIPQPHLMTLSESIFVLFQVSDIDSSSLRNTVPGKGYFVFVGFVVCNPRTPQDLKRKVGYPHNFRTSIQTNSQPLLGHETEQKLGHPAQELRTNVSGGSPQARVASPVS